MSELKIHELYELLELENKDVFKAKAMAKNLRSFMRMKWFANFDNVHKNELKSYLLMKSGRTTNALLKVLCARTVSKNAEVVYVSEHYQFDHQKVNNEIEKFISKLIKKDTKVDLVRVVRTQNYVSRFNADNDVIIDLGKESIKNFDITEAFAYLKDEEVNRVIHNLDMFM